MGKQPHDETESSTKASLPWKYIEQINADAQYLSLWPWQHEFDSGNIFVQFREGKLALNARMDKKVCQRPESNHKETVDTNTHNDEKKHPDGTERLILPLKTTRHGLLGGDIELVNL